MGALLLKGERAHAPKRAALNLAGLYLQGRQGATADLAAVAGADLAVLAGARCTRRAGAAAATTPAAARQMGTEAHRQRRASGRLR